MHRAQRTEGETQNMGCGSWDPDLPDSRGWVLTHTDTHAHRDVSRCEHTHM